MFDITISEKEIIHYPLNLDPAKATGPDSIPAGRILKEST
jgi:hypothetical protein